MSIGFKCRAAWNVVLKERKGDLVGLKKLYSAKRGRFTLTTSTFS